jgi:hypothetical protein
MTFKARYIHRRQLEPEYYRAIHGDSLNDAIKQADRFTRQGFIMAGVTLTNGKED